MIDLTPLADAIKRELHLNAKTQSLGILDAQNGRVYFHTLEGECKLRVYGIYPSTTLNDMIDIRVSDHHQHDDVIYDTGDQTFKTLEEVIDAMHDSKAIQSVTVKTGTTEYVLNRKDLIRE